MSPRLVCIALISHSKMHFVFNGELLEHLLPQFYRQLGRARALFSGGGGRDGERRTKKEGDTEPGKETNI